MDPAKDGQKPTEQIKKEDLNKAVDKIEAEHSHRPDVNKPDENKKPATEPAKLNNDASKPAPVAEGIKRAVEPFTKTNPPAPVPEDKEKKEKRTKLLKEMKDILKEYVVESNIPLNHEYWACQRELRNLDSVN